MKTEGELVESYESMTEHKNCLLILNHIIIEKTPLNNTNVFFCSIGT